MNAALKDDLTTELRKSLGTKETQKFKIDDYKSK